MNVTGSYWWQVNIGSGNGLVPSGNKPSPKQMLSQLYVVIWQGRNELTVLFKKLQWFLVHWIKTRHKHFLVALLILANTCASVITMVASGLAPNSHRDIRNHLAASFTYGRMASTPIIFGRTGCASMDGESGNPRGGFRCHGTRPPTACMLTRESKFIETIKFTLSGPHNTRGGRQPNVPWYTVGLVSSDVQP